DIALSPYEVIDSSLAKPDGTRPACKDGNGKPVPASSGNGDRGGAVCFDVERLIESDLATLVGIAAHEQAHHFGFEDADHAFAEEVAAEYARSFSEEP